LNQPKTIKNFHFAGVPYRRLLRERNYLQESLSGDSCGRGELFAGVPFRRPLRERGIIRMSSLHEISAGEERRSSLHETSGGMKM